MADVQIKTLGGRNKSLDAAEVSRFPCPCASALASSFPPLLSKNDPGDMS